MVGLQYLKQMYGLSDDTAVKRWVENPYWQFFCGEDYFQLQLPIDPSSMIRYRQWIGEAGCEQMLKLTVQAGLQSKTIKPSDLKRNAGTVYLFLVDSWKTNRNRVRSTIRPADQMKYVYRPRIPKRR